MARRRARRRLRGSRQQGRYDELSWTVDAVRVAFSHRTRARARAPQVAASKPNTAKAKAARLPRRTDPDRGHRRGNRRRDTDAGLRRIPRSTRSFARAARCRARCRRSASASQQLAMAQADRAGDRAPRPAGGGGRHRHRQDVRLPRAGAARTAARSSSRPAPRRCRTSSSSATCRWCAMRSRHRSPSRCSRAARTTSATTISSARRARTGCRRATTCATCPRSSRSRAPPSAAIVPSSPTFRRTRRSGRWSPRRATTASVRTARIYRDCFVMKARKEALEADVVVVNHHLFFADVMLRDEGVAELLPSCNTVILDEAHQLPDTATLFFGEQVTAGQLAELARDAEVAARTRCPRRARPARTPRASSRRRAQAAAGRGRTVPGKFAARGGARATGLRAGAGRARGGARPARGRAWHNSPSAARRSRNVAARADEAARRLARWRDADRSALPIRRDRASMDSLGRRHRARLPAAGVAAVGGAADPAPARRQRARLDLHVGDARGRPRLRHYPSQLGLDEAQTRRGTVRSTTRRRRCCTCRASCPRPIRAAHTDAVVDAALPVLEASGGPRVPACSRRCARSRRRASGSPKQSRKRGLDYPLLVQGEGSQIELLDALPRARQRGAARQRELLGGRRRSR